MLRTLRDIDNWPKTALLRVDYNVPIEQGPENIASYDFRLRATLPTICYLIGKNCRVVIASHLRRPGGQRVEEYCLGPIATRLSELLSSELSRRVEVPHIEHCVGATAEKAVASMPPGSAILLENLRFHPGEEKNDPGFARALASLADVFVMDAFAVSHRSHASVVGVPDYLPAVAGCLVQKELEFMGKLLESPARPLGALLGGIKVGDKLLTVERLLQLDKVNQMFLAGGMAIPFLRCQDPSWGGASRFEQSAQETASRILELARSKRVAVCLPEDVVVSDSSTVPHDYEMMKVADVPPDRYIMDIGEKTIERFRDGLSECKTIIWNGTLGKFESEEFRNGTTAIANTVAELDAITVTGGDSTIEAMEALGLLDRLSYVSTGGGASLEFLQGKPLPGIATVLA